MKGCSLRNSYDPIALQPCYTGCMYLAIDVGATKTLLAVFDEAGQPRLKHKIATQRDYEDFLADIKQALNQELAEYQLTAACVAVPGLLDDSRSHAIAFGNLPWQNIPIKQDLAALLPNVKLLIENDTKLAGLYEASRLETKYPKVLYLTISTGISAGLIVNGRIDPVLADSEPGQMLIEHDGQKKMWEDLASGKALVARYGQMASELEDEASWKEYAALIALGLNELLATLQPDVVIIGGGVGAHLEKFQKFLEVELNKAKNPLVPIPPIVKARRPEEAVIYGCYKYITQGS